MDHFYGHLAPYTVPPYTIRINSCHSPATVQPPTVQSPCIRTAQLALLHGHPAIQAETAWYLNSVYLIFVSSLIARNMPKYPIYSS